MKLYKTRRPAQQSSRPVRQPLRVSLLIQSSAKALLIFTLIPPHIVKLEAIIRTVPPAPVSCTSSPASLPTLSTFPVDVVSSSKLLKARSPDNTFESQVDIYSVEDQFAQW